MTSGQKWAMGVTLLAITAVGGEILWLHHERNEAWTPPNAQVEQPTDPDYLVFLKRERPSSLADLKPLIGTTLWVSAADQMDYYPYAAHHADYGKSAGILLGAEPMAIKDTFEQAAPKTATFRIPAGDKQVLLAFTMPKSADPAKEYAVPVGYRQGKDYTFYTDDIFFYEDPHVLYKHWGPQIWQAIDSHQVIMGMNERQVQLSVGQVFKSDSEKSGDRECVFNNLDHPIDVTFVKNKVTAIHPE
ncbi:MAG: hypothetical protein M3O31_08700 [Acidobacteriota bacterium]|nr:hypothetical protein [Acidobacteriota bacterium]